MYLAAQAVILVTELVTLQSAAKLWIFTAESTSATDYKYFPITLQSVLSIGAFRSYKDEDYVAWAELADNTKFTCGIFNDYTGNGYVRVIAIAI